MTTIIILAYMIIGVVGAYYLHPISCDLFWDEDLHRDGYTLGEFIGASLSWMIFWPFHLLILLGMIIARSKIMGKRVR